MIFSLYFWFMCFVLFFGSSARSFIHCLNVVLCRVPGTTYGAQWQISVVSRNGEGLFVTKLVFKGLSGSQGGLITGRDWQHVWK